MALNDCRLPPVPSMSCMFKKFFCFRMCLPIAVAPCSLRVLFAAPFKERSKAHLICKAPQFHKIPTQPLHSSAVGRHPVNSEVAFLANWECPLGLPAWREEFHTLAAVLAEPSGDSGLGQKGPVIIFLCFH